MTRELITPPFPFYKGNIFERVNNMTKRKTVDEVKNDFVKRWGDLYDYSSINEYQNNKQKLPIICRKHGMFPMSANEHLRGHGCPKCADERTSDRCRMKLSDFIIRSKLIHGDYYDYSLITDDSFVNSKLDIEIICPIHGVFKQSRHDHLSGRGCYKCGKISMATKQALTREEVINRCNEIFNNKYDYSLFSEYHSNKDVIMVICPKHGSWPVTVKNHLYNYSGCPHCKRSLGEERISDFLQLHNIKFQEQYRLRNEYLFCKNGTVIVDFYIPKYNTIIEYNGVQHYEESPLFDTRSLEEQIERDNAVRQYCKEHKIKLIEIPYTEYDDIDNILKDRLKI